MAKKLDPHETVSFEDLLTSNIYTQEALVNVLEKKGIVTKRELLEEIKKLKDKQKFGKAWSQNRGNEKLNGKKILISVLFILILWGSPPSIHSQEQTPSPAISVYFSPKGGCTEAIVKALDKAKSSILVQAYSFTSDPIAKALLNTHKRGVKIEVILDKSRRTQKYSEADFLIHMGIPTKIDAAHPIAHNKVMIIDGETVITGSFNFTKQAEEKNAENLLVIRDKVLAEKYIGNWKMHEGHSEVYQ